MGPAGSIDKVQRVIVRDEARDLAALLRRRQLAGAVGFGDAPVLSCFVGHASLVHEFVVVLWVAGVVGGVGGGWGAEEITEWHFQIEVADD